MFLLKFFIDTANLDEIKEAYSLGIVSGVTTNPSLVAKEGVDFKQRLKEITEVVKEESVRCGRHDRRRKRACKHRS